MARKNTTDDESKLVTLVHPDGTEYRSNSPREINQLLFGLGYTLKDVATYDEALEYLGDEAAVLALPETVAPSGAIDAATATDTVSVKKS